MVSGVVGSQVLKRVPGKRVAAVIIYSLKSGANEEADSLTSRHACEEVSEAGAAGIEEEAFKGVVVEGTVGVGDVEAMVAGVECCCGVLKSALL